MAAPLSKRKKMAGCPAENGSVKPISVKPAAVESTIKKPSKALTVPSKAADEEQGDDDISTGEDDEDDELDIDNASSADSDGESGYSDSSTSSLYENNLKDPSQNGKKRKRNDPDAFSTSMSKILASHLTTTARKDPILVRSKQAAQQIDDSKLEAKARRLLTLDKKKELDKDRIKDVVPKGDVDGEAVKKVMEREKALRKVAQRGVVKLFNAVRAAQMKGEEALVQSKAKGVIGMDTRESKVTEMSKQGFLDLIQTSGKGK